MTTRRRQFAHRLADVDNAAGKADVRVSLRLSGSADPANAARSRASLRDALRPVAFGRSFLRLMSEVWSRSWEAARWRNTRGSCWWSAVCFPAP